MVDQDVIRQFVRDVGHERAVDLAGLYIDETRDHLNVANELIDSDETRVPDWRRLARVAHSMKSAAGTYGLSRLGRLAETMEKAGRDENAAVYQDVLEILSDEAEKHFRALISAIDSAGNSQKNS